ncbi:Uncharacterized protein FWK35_00032676 [Aphis craccivora]|uniref:Uncharacterized protein n=1 Tax=Aphis craccivora TaxID=307492 RepID=A0A6G0VYG3_APHCR|nr:Uncharacterized protein FWK35_00032676 [Aphis craccivora]
MGKKCEEKWKIALMLHCLGFDILPIYNSFEFRKTNNAANYDAVINSMNILFRKRTWYMNSILHNMFFARDQKTFTNSIKLKWSLKKKLGVVNYVGKFLLNAAQVNAPLRELIRKYVKFELTKAYFVNGAYKLIGNAAGVNVNMRLRRLQPMFPPNTWDVHDTTLHGSHRTNNPTEGWNNRFPHLVGQKHPTIWKLIRKIKNIVDADLVKLALNDVSEPFNKRKKAGKWVPLCYTLGAVWITIYCRTVKFESNDNYHCIRKTILNEDD